MKIIHLSDLHIGKKLNNYSFIDDQKYILNQILEKIDILKPDFIFIAGDIYDKSVPTAEAVELFDCFLTELVKKQVKVFIIYGNHDSAERLSFASNILKSNNIFISKIFEGTVEKFSFELENNTVNIFLLPFIKPITVRKYFPDVQIKDYNDAVKTVIDNTKIDCSQINLILAHQFLTGSEICESEELAIGGLDNVDVSVFYKFDYVALGHLHKSQKVKKDNIRYSGTPLKYSISEKNHIKSFTVIQINKKNDIKISKEILTPKRDLIEIKGKLKEISDKNYYKNINTQNYISIVLTDEEEDINAYSILNSIYKNILKISYENKRTKNSNSFEIDEEITQKNTLDIFDDLYLMQNGSNMTQEQKQYLIKIIDEIEGE